MDVFLAVLRDLYDFIFGRSVAPPLSLPPTSSEPLRKPIAEAPHRSTENVLPMTELFSTVYVRENDTPLFIRPVLAYDETIEKLSYGTPLQLVRYEGRYAQVKTPAMGTAWILKDAIIPHKGDVLPAFVDGQVYDAHASETVSVRTFLRDEFSAQALLLPLQAGEYVSYRWRHSQRSLPWGKERPRLPGRWQQLLRGRRELVFSITPKTGAIMEYLDEEGVGQLAYVEAVHPDGSVQVSGFDGMGEGRYFERLLSGDEWKEFRPV